MTIHADTRPGNRRTYHFGPDDKGSMTQSEMLKHLPAMADFTLTADKGLRVRYHGETWRRFDQYEASELAGILRRSFMRPVNVGQLHDVARFIAHQSKQTASDIR